MKMPAAFVHLQVHSEYSLKDSLIRLERPEPIQNDKHNRHLEPRFQTLSERAAEISLPALALTDNANLFAAVKFYKSALAHGVKPILGAELMVTERVATDAPESLTLLVQNAAGYRNLLELVSQAYVVGQTKGQPLLEREWLKTRSEGLIALSGRRGEIGRALLGGQIESAQTAAAQWRQVFGDRFYLAISRCNRPDDESHLKAAVAFSRMQKLPVVATNDVRFLRREDHAAHEARVCIATGYTLDDPRHNRDTTAEQFLKPAEDMARLFADLPEAVENTIEIARRCNLTLTLGSTHLPAFPVPAGTPVSLFLRQQAERGLHARLPAPDKSYPQRLDYELGVIEKMGYAGYFLVVADFIRWAKSNGVPVGPGRGSGAGSLVAYSLGITDLDPIPYDLLFERFLNPERVSMPDFDVDFCMMGRDRVIEYVAEKYGRDHVGQIITYGTMAARAVVRDAARVLGHPYGLGDRIAKMIPGGPQGLSLGEALDQVQELQQACRSEEDVKAVLELGLQLEGLTRNVGKHAGGVVIAPRALSDFAPLYCEPGGGGLVTQYDMKDLEAVGLVKFDFLGLKTLTIIQMAVEQINAKRPAGEPPLEILKLPLTDPKVYELYASGNTSAVFQMESGGMQRASVGLKPDCFEDIIALISLFRPGPMDLIPDFIERKRGRAQVKYLHPAMEEALKPTLGIFVYQEQVMQIAQKLAGYTLAGADLLRRAMGKKIAAEMDKQRSIFIEGAQKNGLSERTATEIFDQMDKFANYGFNKSHAAAYALVSYQTAWLKTHYPADFMSAVLSCDMDKTDTVVMMIDECRRMGIDIVPPDINRSDLRFSVGTGQQIIYGLGAIKGAGEGALAGVLEERRLHGPFADLFDFCRRINTHKANKRVLEALICSGAMDRLGANRPTLMKQLPVAVQFAEQSQNPAGQVDLFGVRTSTAIQPAAQTVEPPWPDAERLRHEKNTLGLYLSGHPIEGHRAFIEELTGTTLKKSIESAPAADPAGGFARRGSKTLVAGWVVDVRRFGGGRRALLVLDDRTARISVPLNEDMLAAGMPKADTLLFVQGRISADTYTGGWQIFPDKLFDANALRAQSAERVVIQWPKDRALNAETLMQLLAPARLPQGAPVTVRYINGTTQATLDLGEEWRVSVQEDRLAPLKRQLGENGVSVHYRRVVLAPQKETQHAYES